MDSSIEVSTRSPRESAGDKIACLALLIFLLSLVLVLVCTARGRTPWEAYRLSRARRGISLAVAACTSGSSFPFAYSLGAASLKGLNSVDYMNEEAALNNDLLAAACGRQIGYWNGGK
jgi:hypothetical protein